MLICMLLVVVVCLYGYHSVRLIVYFIVARVARKSIPRVARPEGSASPKEDLII